MLFLPALRLAVLMHVLTGSLTDSGGEDALVLAHHAGVYGREPASEEVFFRRLHRLLGKGQVRLNLHDADFLARLVLWVLGEELAALLVGVEAAHDAVLLVHAVPHLPLLDRKSVV